MKDLVTYFITWTTYGTWLPGDVRGWRKMKQGNQIPQPRLEEWCRERMKGDTVILSPKHRAKVEAVSREHAEVRCWKLHAINVRSNHVHIAVTSDKPPKITRDQFKANGTRVLREDPDAITDEKIWTRGGDTEIIEGEYDLECVIEYILEEQDKKG